MRHRGLKHYAFGAGGMLALVLTILLATGWGTAVAAQITNVFVTNDTTHPVPVHEQGTANVNVTNKNFAIAPAAPITDGGGFFGLTGGLSADEAGTASAVSVHLADGVSFLQLKYGGANGTSVAYFLGPAGGGNSSITLALTRPISFDWVNCDGVETTTTACTMSWVGNNP